MLQVFLFFRGPEINPEIEQSNAGNKCQQVRLDDQHYIQKYPQYGGNRMFFNQSSDNRHTLEKIEHDDNQQKIE